MTEEQRRHLQTLDLCERKILRLLAERDRLLWLACVQLVEGEYQTHTADDALRILAEHGYDVARIERVASVPEPRLP